MYGTMVGTAGGPLSVLSRQRPRSFPNGSNSGFLSSILYELQYAGMDTVSNMAIAKPIKGTVITSPYLEDERP
jgi:hypothetical protein